MSFGFREFLYQCQLAQWEEELDTDETLTIGPQQSVSYARLLCAGQTVDFRVASAAGSTILIGIEECPPAQTAQCEAPGELAIRYQAPITGYYSLTVRNDGRGEAGFLVKIRAERRRPCARTKKEAIVRALIRLASRPEPMHRVVAVKPQNRQTPHTTKAPID